MYLNKKACAVLAALTLELSGAALAASADSFSDVPKDHWSYEALDYLAQEGVIEGMGDNTFEGGRTMTRYEVASIVAKAMQKGGGSFGDKAVLEKLHGEYADEISVLRQQVAANTKQIDQNTKDIDELKNGIAGKMELSGFVRVQYDHDKYSGQVQNNSDLYKDNNRFYMSLNGAYKVNDNWKAKFQLEKIPSTMVVTTTKMNRVLGRPTGKTRDVPSDGPVTTVISSVSGSKGRILRPELGSTLAGHGAV